MSIEAISNGQDEQVELVPRGMVSPRVSELVAWASMVDPGRAPTAPRHDQALDALAEAADGDGDLVHRAWLLALRALRDGSVTRSSVSLLRATAEKLLSTAHRAG